MSLTFIDTNTLAKKAIAGHGEVAEILSKSLCGAHNVHGSVRWLNPGESFEPESIDRHQLIYLMDGRGSIRLDAKSYDVERGAGVYLGPRETATIRPADGAALKLFHLIVPRIPK
jgi:AraC-like ligand binding domain